MRIATWNINSIRLRMVTLIDFANKFSPDVIALQETKVEDSSFPHIECISMGYPYIRMIGEKSYNGVAILSKYPIDETFSLQFYNEQRRHIAVRCREIEIHNFYVPAGGEEPDTKINEKFRHKLSYLDSMHEWFMKNRNKDQKIILVGDLNIAPLENDVWSSKGLKNTISHTDVERKILTRNLEEFGFVDGPRKFVNESEKLYSWWSYRSTDWQKSDKGRRLDHIWVSEALSDSLVGTFTVKKMREHLQPSDHVPVIIDIK